MMQELGSSKKARTVGLALLVVAFVTGALTGAAVNSVLTARDAGAAAEPDSERRERRLSTEDFLARLELTNDQRAQIDSILTQSRAQIDSVWSELRPRMRAYAASARNDIAQVLTEEQRAQYERFLAEQRSRHHKTRGQDSVEQKER